MCVTVRGFGPIVAQLHVAQQEDSLPGNQYVIEKDDGIHLLEPGPQGVIEVGTAQVKALATQKLQAWRITGDGKGKGVAPLRILRELAVPGGVYGNLIGQWSQGS